MSEIQDFEGFTDGESGVGTLTVGSVSVKYPFHTYPAQPSAFVRLCYSSAGLVVCKLTPWIQRARLLRRSCIAKNSGRPLLTKASASLAKSGET